MTLIINIVTPEGIIMASDSRQTERNIKQFTRISTNSAIKLFSLNDRVIVGTAGLAFFADNTGIRKNVSDYIEAFKKDNKLDSLTVDEISTKLKEISEIFKEINTIRSYCSDSKLVIITIYFCRLVWLGCN